ncbi:cytochrome P450 [Bailinhaonella thermotolerans]|uniref:cytochrome P450 n=1 Tax=Bailinhaonella thermotolerans TaxID=1070861 RepID=UPI0011C38205|nr:cytochrome P450 [Bailinhaonella thermotolerans]
MAEPIATIPFESGPGHTLPRELARRLAEEPLGPVRLPTGDVVTLAVRHADIVAVLTDPRFSRDLRYPGAPRIQPGLDISDNPDLLVNMDGAEHARLRRLLSGTFTPRQIEKWRPRVREIAGRLLDGLGPPGTVTDLIEAYTFPIPITVICEIFGVEGLDHERVRAWSETILTVHVDNVEEQVTSTLRFMEYVRKLVAEHRGDPGDGLLRLLLDARDEDDRLTEDELVNTVMGLIAAGHDTTANVLARGLLRLLSEGEYAGLVRDPSRIPAAVEEMLRWDPPGDSTLLRVATEDVDLPSGRIAAGEVVLPMVRAANFDPGVLRDPGDFRPARGECPHLSFGRGAHYCLGANLARMELQEALRVLVDRVPTLRLAVPAEEIPWQESALTSRLKRLPTTH